MTTRRLVSSFCALLVVAIPVVAQPVREADQSVLVARFSNISQDQNDDWIGDGIAETVASDLQSLGGLSVVGRETVASPTGDSLSALPDTGRAVQLAQMADARWAVIGGYQRVGPMLRITARLVDARSARVVETLTVDGPIDEIFDLQDQLVAGLLAGVTSVPVVARSAPTPAAELVPDGSAEGEGEGFGFSPSPRQPSPGPVTGGIVLPEAVPEAGRGGRRREESLPVATAAAGILTGRPSVVATRTPDAPTIDGLLDDPVWNTAVRVTDFVQVAPVEGALATEDTEIFVAYDSDTLYLGMYAHYSNSAMVRANRVDRDQAFFGDDTISVYFDTFLDQQRAFVFTINGYGVQGDSLMAGSSGGGFRGGFSGVPWGDRSWDALFESGGVLVDDGWTAELAIPFKSLRYPSGDAHRWGFQIARSIRGKDETVVWAPVSRDVSGFLPQMGLLDGLSGLSTSRNLEILPTVTAIQAGSLNRSTRGFEEESQPEGGVNLKYGLTPNLTLDFTYNPDFSQIESDRPQIEVNQRFPLFYSELRPFFLEGQEIFDIQGPVTFINTRTIVDPRYGGKITGKVGKTTMGFLFANDEAPGKLDDPTERGFGKSANTLIGRVRYDLYSQSHVGAVVTDREFLGSYSRLAGVDSRFQISPTTSVDFAALTTVNQDLDGNRTGGPMLDGGLRSNGRNLSYRVSLYQLDPEFDTEVGFIRRRDIRRISSSVGYRWWPESWIINWGPEFQYSRNWNFEDVLEDEESRLRMRVSFARNVSVYGDVRREMERFGGINFDKIRQSIGGNVSTSRLFSLGGSYNWGDQVRFSTVPFLGAGSSGRLFMSLRPFSRLQSQINLNTSRLVDPEGQAQIFDVKIYRALTTYQFTDRLLLRNIMEHNSFSKTLGANLLLTYRVNSGTVFFIGYDDRYQAGNLLFDDDGEEVYFTSDLARTNRAFFTKISYLFRY
jgi:TolB-like protein